MRRKARAKRASSRETNANGNFKARENSHLMVMKQVQRPIHTPAGKGLGKAGAKRLGRLLKRAIQVQEFTGKGKASLPKTPVRLFKHQIKSEAERGPNQNTATPTSLHVSQLILGVVSQCKHRGGISMVELKETLAAGGYDVTKNNRHMNIVTQRLVNTETLVRTTRNATLRLNKKHMDTKEIRMASVKSKPHPKADLQQRKTARKSIKAAEKPQTRARKTPKPKGKSHKLRDKTRTATRKTRKAKRKPPKQTGNKHRSAIKRLARVRKAPRKTQRTLRRRPKQTRRPYKSSWKRPTQKRRLPKTRPRLKTQRRRAAWRRVYYYYY